jgi:hypothetical protein
MILNQADPITICDIQDVPQINFCKTKLISREKQ